MLCMVGIMDIRTQMQFTRQKCLNPKHMLEHRSVYSPSKQELRSLLLDDKSLLARFVASFKPCFQRMEASLSSIKLVSFLSKTFLLIGKVH